LDDDKRRFPTAWYRKSEAGRLWAGPVSPQICHEHETGKDEMSADFTKDFPRPERPIDPGTRIGHVHLKVANIPRALEFYIGVLGFELITTYNDQAAFISAGGYHHHIALNTWESLNGSPPPRGSTGLFHLAILYPTRAALADALKRVEEAGIPLDGASDHGVSEALYLRDPDENGVELYWDRPREDWPKDQDGGIEMYTRRLDLAALRAEVDH
jgi:catechol 2,3-dioxygenase